jgi:hypothetical protein
MLIPVEARPQVISWLQMPRLCNVEGSEVTIVDTEKMESGDTENVCFKVFFPEVAIANVHDMLDLRRLGKEEESKQNEYDVCPQKDLDGSS